MTSPAVIENPLLPIALGHGGAVAASPKLMPAASVGTDPPELRSSTTRENVRTVVAEPDMVAGTVGVPVIAALSPFTSRHLTRPSMGQGLESSRKNQAQSEVVWSRF